MKVGILFSGGKDSTFALYKASEEHDVVCLIAMKSLNPHSYMFHVPNIDFVKEQAEALGIPLVFVETEGKKEEELEDLEKAMKIAKEKYHIEAIASGALASEYQLERVNKLCENLDLKSLAYLWHFDPEEYLNELIDSGFEVIIVGIAADGLDESFLGAKIDKEMVEKLKKVHEKTKIHIAAEGGEFETMVLSGPMFKKKLKILDSEIVMENEFTGQLVVKKIELT
jgi:ABC transporter with metal-binding/Fe-S-binding domain ATP-binding protein